MDHGSLNLCYSKVYCIFRSGIIRSCGNSVFNFLRKCQTVFYSELYHFAFPSAMYRVQISPHPYQHLLFSIVLIVVKMTILVCMKWYLTFVLTFISLMTNAKWFLFAKFRLKLKKVGKTTRPFKYDINHIPYDWKWQIGARD